MTKVCFRGIIKGTKSSENGIKKGMKMMDKQMITDKNALAYLEKCGHKPEDFRMVEIDVYADLMNDGNFNYLGKEMYVVKEEFAEEVALIGYNFTHTKVTLYNKAEEELDATIGIGYDDLCVPTAFSLGDVEDVVARMASTKK